MQPAKTEFRTIKWKANGKEGPLFAIFITQKKNGLISAEFNWGTQRGPFNWGESYAVPPFERKAPSIFKRKAHGRAKGIVLNRESVVF